MKDNGDAMSELLHQNTFGIKIVREDYKKRSQVKVFSETGGKRIVHRAYRFNLIPDRFDSPFISWANLDRCGGWLCDDSYLDTAVQEGKKLYAARKQVLKTSYFPDKPSKDEALQQFQKLIDSFPDGVTGGIDTMFNQENFLFTFICRKGRIADYFDIDNVFEFYSKLGFRLPQNVVDKVKTWCNIEIKDFGGEQAPFHYSNPYTPEEFITTGLLLGYPLESTASIICGY